MFAEEVTAAIDSYSREVTDAVVEKAQKLCTLYSKVLNKKKNEVNYSSAINCGRPLLKKINCEWPN